MPGSSSKAGPSGSASAHMVPSVGPDPESQDVLAKFQALGLEARAEEEEEEDDDDEEEAAGASSTAVPGNSGIGEDGGKKKKKKKKGKASKAVQKLK